MGLFKRTQKIQDNGKPEKTRKRVYPPIARARAEVSKYSQSEVLGTKARLVLSQLSELERMREHLDDVLARRFGYASITYGKFSTESDSASKVFCMNCQELASKMSLFDVGEYKRLRSAVALMDAGSREGDRGNPGERLSIMEQALSDMDAIPRQNREILDGMEQLVKDIADSESSEGDLASEIKALVEEHIQYTEKLQS